MVRPWPQLIRLVDSLPAHSHFRRAVADDDDLARRAAERPTQTGKPSGPALRDWTEHEELLATLTDGFNLVRLSIAASVTPKGKRPPKFNPVRRPETAAARERKRHTVAVHTDLLARLTRGE